jgi:hypothetical protein
VDAETEAAIEEEILGGLINPGHLRQIEEELIEDSIFGRLSMAKHRAFKSKFLSDPKPRGKLESVHSLQHHGVEYAPEAARRGAWVRLRELAAVPWLLPQHWAAVWLARNRNLTHTMAQIKPVNDEHQRVVASMIEHQQRQAHEAAPSIQPIASTPSPGLAPEREAFRSTDLPSSCPNCYLVL